MRSTRPTTIEAHERLNRRVVRCKRCPRLIDHCRDVAKTKRAAYRDDKYWGKPVPDFGDPEGHLLIVGLAPGAHGANRTGRMFTGDRSGELLFEALHRAGYANQPECTGRDDGLALTGALITNTARCAPPGNKPTADELDTCFDYLNETVHLMPNLSVIVALGGIAHNACVKLYRTIGWSDMKPKPKFGHASECVVDNAPTLVGCYHPSQQNTFTKRLTMDMLVDVFAAAKRSGRIRP